MAPTQVQQVTAAASSGAPGSQVLTLPGAPKPGNALILCVCNYLGDTVTSVTGGGVTWQPYAQFLLTTGGGSGTAEIWAGFRGSGASSQVSLGQTYSGGYNNVATVMEWAGLAGFDKASGTSNQMALVNVQTPSLTPAGPGELIIGVATETNGTTAGATAPFQQVGTFFSAGGGSAAAAYEIAATAAAVSTSWTQNMAGTYATAIAAFKPVTFKPVIAMQAVMRAAVR